MKALVLASVIALAVSIGSGPPVEAQAMVLGTLVEVSPETRTILLRVGVADGEPILRRFRLADSARIRVDGGFARLADVLVGQTARVEFIRANGPSIAELVDVTTAPPAGSPLSDSARIATSIEERRRYLDEASRTLDVLEESAEELSQYPEVEGTEGLTRRAVLVEELEARIDAARSLLESTSPTASQDTWAVSVDRLDDALADASAAHERAWSIVANR
jgi:hypothetical protein